MSRTTSVRDLAQAVSGVLDDVQAGNVGETTDLSQGLFVHDYVDGGQSRSSWVTEISAELTHEANGAESFTVKTSDGRTFRITVSEA